MSETNISVIDTKSLSEPISKLIGAVQSAIGVLYEPTQTRRKAKADADASLIKMKADLAIRDLAARAEGRVKAKELRRQQNIESILEKAAQFLPETVSNEKVDEDWIVQFFEQSQDVGKEELQTLWSKLLAGEIVRPGTYSLRTVQIVKILGKEDAELFTKVCSCIWQTQDELDGVLECSLLYTEDALELIRRKGIFHSSLLHLQSIGLMTGWGTVYTIGEQNERFFFYRQEHKFNTIRKSNIPAYPLTESGRELFPICGAEPDEEYRVKLIESLVKEGITTEVIAV
jgi:uncharacterized repeat protein (TIGR03899 family)